MTWKNKPQARALARNVRDAERQQLAGPAAALTEPASKRAAGRARAKWQRADIR